LFCDYGHLNFRDGDYIVLPRGTAWRIHVRAEAQVLLIEATNDSYPVARQRPLGKSRDF
jgi:homogentisate 1,2-dioxygenase